MGMRSNRQTVHYHTKMSGKTCFKGSLTIAFFGGFVPGTFEVPERHPGKRDPCDKRYEVVNQDVWDAARTMESANFISYISYLPMCSVMFDGPQNIPDLGYHRGACHRNIPEGSCASQLKYSTHCKAGPCDRH